MKALKYVVMIALSLALVFVVGCGQDKSKSQEQPISQEKGSVQTQTKSNEPRILEKKIIGTRKVGLTKPRIQTIEERKVEKTLPNGQKIIEINYYDAETGNQILNYNPDRKKADVSLKNEGKQVAEFKSN